MPGGNFIAFQHNEYGKDVEGTMIIGSPKRWGSENAENEVYGHWFEGSTGNYFIYLLEADNTSLTYWLESKESGFKFHAKFNEDKTILTGGWRWPDGGGYDLVMTKIL